MAAAATTTHDGGKGNDTYFVDDGNDKVSEDIGEGKDTVFASDSFTLETGQEVEILTLTGRHRYQGYRQQFGQHHHRQRRQEQSGWSRRQ